MALNPSAARSLEEGMEETLRVHKLGVPDQLRRTLACTNVIESAFSIVETVCRNVKRWRNGDQIERWVGSGLLVAEQQFRRFQEAICEGSSRRVAYEFPGSPTFNGAPGNLHLYGSLDSFLDLLVQALEKRDSWNTQPKS
jgi:hypothetical protein